MRILKEIKDETLEFSYFFTSYLCYDILITDHTVLIQYITDNVYCIDFINLGSVWTPGGQQAIVLKVGVSGLIISSNFKHRVSQNIPSRKKKIKVVNC
jgi:hypothetical protein